MSKKRVFEGSAITKKVTCSCPIRLSELHCQILALLLFLSNFAETKEKTLELLYTEKLQKLPCRSKKSFLPMVTQKEI